MTSLASLAAAAVVLAATTPLRAQALVKPDGQWRATAGLAASHASGNTRSSSIALQADAVRATAADKINLYGNALRASSGGSTTAEQVRAGGRYERNLDRALFAFGTLDLERDKPANLKRRGVVGAGLGWRVLRGPDTSLDVFAGVGYTDDSYFAPALIDGRLRRDYGYANAMLGQESVHKLSETTSAKQRLVVLPNLSDRGEYRATWDAGVAVAMTKALSLTAGVAWRYNSAPGAGRRTTDTLLTTGIAVKFE